MVGSWPVAGLNSTVGGSLNMLVVASYREEWGNPLTDPYYEYMLTYSPYDNVKAQDYPAMLVTAGLQDSRVHYWEPAKWVARLRDRKTDDRPILFQCKVSWSSSHPQLLSWIVAVLLSTDYF